MIFGRDDVLRVLHGFNPWWSRRALALPKFRRQVYAACRSHLESSSAEFVLLLSGLRGAGKTTLLLQLATDLVAAGYEPRSILYLGMGHPLLSRVPLSEVLGLYRSVVHAKDKPALLLLDEMHYARDWDQEVKKLLTDGSGYRIIATESMQMITRALVTETQVGRWSALSAPPLSFHEYLSLRGLDPGPAVPELDLVAGGTISAKALTKAVDALSRAMEVFPAYLAAGGMPWLAQQTDAAASRSVMREDVAESILRRDVGLHFGARNVEDLKRLFVFLCLHSGEVFPVQRYAKAVETSAATVANHVELLERCFLVRRLPPVATRGEEVQKARFRVFVTDTTLRNSELLRDADHLHDGDDMRRVVGTCVVRHVVERHARSLARISYWRDARTRRAVDVVVQDVDGTAIFHSMYGPPTQVTDRDCPAHFSRSEGVKRAFLVTRDEDDVGVLRLPGLETEFVKVPAHVVAYLLGRAESKAATP